MEQYFDSQWPAGRTMMRNTASVQVNLDLGEPGDVADRWRRAHDLGPLLVGVFANSPLDPHSNPTGWCSTRFAVWDGIDPSRTGVAYRDDHDPCAAFTDYALEAGVMMVWPDGPDGDALVPEPGLPFGDWIDHGHALGQPTLADFEYHLTTLFPPVRPRGWLELRMIDALPDESWPVAVAVATALLDHPGAVAATDAAITSLRGRWTPAARHGLSDPATRTVAEHCFAVTAEALPDLGASADLVAALDAYRDRYVDRGRSPAHDILEAHVAARRSGS